MNKKNYVNILIIFSISIFIISLLVFLYSFFNRRYSIIKLEENKKILAEISANNRELESLKSKISKKEDKYKLLKENFKNNYGYEFEDNEISEIKATISGLNSENKKNLEEMKVMLNNYRSYYDSNIYTNDNFDFVVSNFIKLSDKLSGDKYGDIFNDLEINLLTDKSNGNVQYIRSINKNIDNRLRLLIFQAAINSYRFNLFINGENIEPIEIYADIVNLHSTYKEMENLGYNTGKLKSENLIYLSDNFLKHTKEYYKNNGIIKSLESGVQNEN